MEEVDNRDDIDHQEADNSHAEEEDIDLHWGSIQVEDGALCLCLAHGLQVSLEVNDKRWRKQKIGDVRE